MMSNIEDFESTKQRSEQLKREGQEVAIDRYMEMLNVDPDIARRFATSLLEEIQEGNNKDLEERFRAKVAELGIELDA